MLASPRFRPLLACSPRTFFKIRTSAFAPPLYLESSIAYFSETPSVTRPQFHLTQWLATTQHCRGFHILSRHLNKNEPPEPPPKVLLRKRLGVLAPIVHEKVWNVPNVLTFSRLFAAPVIGYLLLHDQHLWAFSLFVYAGVTDLIDGWIARTFNQSTVVGTVIDPMADKLLMTIVTVTLASNGSMPLYLAVLILGRDILLAISAIYYRYISLPPPKTFARYWDFSLPSAEVRPTGISKINTALQLGLIGATMGMPLVSLGPWAATALTGLQYTVAVTTVWSGASYIYSKDAVKILNQDQNKDDEEGETDEQDIAEKNEKKQ